MSSEGTQFAWPKSGWMTTRSTTMTGRCTRILDWIDNLGEEFPSKIKNFSLGSKDPSKSFFNQTHVPYKQ